jgi:hypothetical protein
LVAFVYTEDVSHSERLGSKRSGPSSAIAGHLGFSLREFFRCSKEEKYFEREPGREAIFIGLLTGVVTACFVLPGEIFLVCRFLEGIVFGGIKVARADSGLLNLDLLR